MRFIKFGCLVILALSVTGSKPSKFSSKLNVLFIVADDLNCALGAYGDPLAITPNLDKLAKKGLVFNNAHVQYPFVVPLEFLL